MPDPAPEPGGTSDSDASTNSNVGHSGPRIVILEGRGVGELAEMLASALAQIASSPNTETNIPRADPGLAARDGDQPAEMSPETNIPRADSRRAAGNDYQPAVTSPETSISPADSRRAVGDDNRPAKTSLSARAFARPVQLWIRQVADGDDEVALEKGFKPYRDLWQLRCGLPRSERSELPTSAFTEADIDEFVAVNNRAFHWHPEQGGLTADDVREQMAEPWFNADGFRLHHHNGRLAGFCWTKIHPDDSPPLGEIYVIAVDPEFVGRGVGRRLTLAGLEWLTDQGLRTGMLYVESDNHPANAVYRRIGFELHHTDRAYWYQPA